jgi:hypothetical protein
VGEVFRVGRVNGPAIPNFDAEDRPVAIKLGTCADRTIEEVVGTTRRNQRATLRRLPSGLDLRHERCDLGIKTAAVFSGRQVVQLRNFTSEVLPKMRQGRQLPALDTHNDWEDKPDELFLPSSLGLTYACEA